MTTPYRPLATVASMTISRLARGRHMATVAAGGYEETFHEQDPAVRRDRLANIGGYLVAAIVELQGAADSIEEELSAHVTAAEIQAERENVGQYSLPESPPE